MIGRKLVRQDTATGGFWNTVVRVVMRYPVPSLVISGGLMVAAAVPALDLETGFNGVDVLPDRLQTKQAFLILEEDFSFGVASPVDIVVDGDADDPVVAAAMDALREQLGNDPDFAGFSTITVSPARNLTLLSVPVAGEPSSERAVSAVRRLRDDIVPAAFAGVPAEAYVGGTTSTNIDFFDVTDDYMPIVFAFVSSVSAAYGLLVPVF